jgi:hypothetical protein
MVAEIPDAWMLGTSLRPGEVADLFNVDRATVTKWANVGIIGYFRTPNGDRRYPECEVKRLVKGGPPPDFLKELAEQDRVKYRDKWKSGWRKNEYAAQLAQKKAERDADEDAA